MLSRGWRRGRQNLTKPRFASTLFALHCRQILAELRALRWHWYIQHGAGQCMQRRRANDVDVANFNHAIDVDAVGQANYAIFQHTIFFEKLAVVATKAEFDAVAGKIDDSRA